MWERGTGKCRGIEYRLVDRAGAEENWRDRGMFDLRKRDLRV